MKIRPVFLFNKNMHPLKDRDWFQQGTFDNYVIKGYRLDINTDIHGVFNECTNQLIGYIKVQSYPQLFNNNQYYHLQEIHIDTEYYGQGALSNLVFFIINETHRKIYLNEHMIREYGYCFKKLLLETSMIAKGYNNSKEYISNDASILDHPSKLHVVVDALHNQEPHGRIEGFHYPVLFKDGSFD